MKTTELFLRVTRVDFDYWDNIVR